MTLTELRYIVAVSRERNFGRAATRCFVSQPTLSIAIKKLEDELNITLFERGGNEISITDVGVRIVEQAQRVLEEAEIIKRMASEQQNELSGQLKIGIIFTISPYLLPKLIPSIHKLAPDMPLMLEENYTLHLTEMLKGGEVDAIIVADPFDEPNTIAYPLYDEPFVVATPLNHPLAKRKSINVKELANQSVLLLSPGNCFRDQVLASCSELAAKQQSNGGIAGMLQGSSINTIRHMVASGVGITVLPSTSVSIADKTLLSVIPFTQPAPTRRVLLVTRKQFFRKRAIETLRQAILQSGLSGVKMLDDD